MTVAELIEELKDYPPDMRVVTRGYEAGYDEPYLAKVTVAVDENWENGKKPHWYFGRHGDNPDEGEGTEALAL